MTFPLLEEVNVRISSLKYRLQKLQSSLPRSPASSGRFFSAVGDDKEAWDSIDSANNLLLNPLFDAVNELAKAEKEPRLSDALSKSIVEAKTINKLLARRSASPTQAVRVLNKVVKGIEESVELINRRSPALRF